MLLLVFTCDAEVQCLCDVSAAMELPGTVIVLFLISRVSRLKILIGGNILSGVSLILITVVSNANIQVFLASLGLVGMAISFPTIYLYSGELFPTVVRNVGVGLGSISARIGSIIAPYIATMVIYDMRHRCRGKSSYLHFLANWRHHCRHAHWEFKFPLVFSQMYISAYKRIFHNSDDILHLTNAYCNVMRFFCRSNYTIIIPTW